jgi:hypothetical protein
MTKSKSKLLSLIIVFSLFISIVGAVNVDFSYAASKRIHLKKTTVTLAAGSKYQQKLISKSGKTIKATKVKWKSQKKSVAKINKKGKITAVKAGTAKMIAKYKGKTYKFTVKVKNTNNLVSVDKSDVAILPGGTAEVVVHTDKGKSVSCKVDNKDVASFEWGSKISGTHDKTLYIKGLTKGSATVTVYDTYKTSVKATIKVTVADHNTKISVDQETVDLSVGETVSLVVKTDLGQDIIHTSSNKNISCSWGKWIDGTTNRYLYVTGEKEGTSTITISDKKDAGVSTALTVNVKDPHIIKAPSSAVCKEYDADGNEVSDINISTITVEKQKLLKYRVVVRISGTRTKCADDIKLPPSAKISVSLCQNGVSRYEHDILVLGDSFDAECIITDVEAGEYELVINGARSIKDISH